MIAFCTAREKQTFRKMFIAPNISYLLRPTGRQLKTIFEIDFWSENPLTTELLPKNVIEQNERVMLSQF